MRNKYITSVGAMYSTIANQTKEIFADTIKYKAFTREFALTRISSFYSPRTCQKAFKTLLDYEWIVPTSVSNHYVIK